MRKTSYDISFPPEKDKSVGRPEAASSKLYNKYKHANTTTEFYARGGNAATLRWDMMRGICVFKDPELEAARVKWAAEQTQTSDAHKRRQATGGVRASLNTCFAAADIDEPEPNPRWLPSALEQAVLHMSESELELFATFVDTRPDVKHTIQRALIKAHAKTLNLSEREYEDLQRGVVVPKIPSSEYSMLDTIHDTTHDMFMCSHGGHFCLDQDCDHTNCVSDEIVLRLVGPDDIEIVPDEIIDLGNYSQEQREEFIKAFSKEIRGLADIGTFQEVNFVPKGKKVLKSKNVYKIKLKADGSFDKFKTRTTAKGFHQRLGEEYFSTFSPTGNLTIFRMLLAIAVRFALIIYQSDLPMAFLQSDIDADIIMELPPGSYYRTIEGLRSKLVQLARSLYGTKQAPQLFNHELNHWLTTVANFTRCDAEPCLYWYIDENGFVLIFDLVDDLLITGNNDIKIEEMRVGLEKRFARDPRFGKVTWDHCKSYYGINVDYKREQGVLKMNLIGKIDQFFKDHPRLAKLNGNRTKPISTPLPVAHGHGKSVDTTGDRGTDNDLLIYLRDNYRHFTGCLIFMAISCRVDLAQAVATISQKMQTPTLDDARLLRHTLRYLDFHRNLSLVYKREGNAIEELISEISYQDPNIFVLTGADDIDNTDIFGMHDANFQVPKSTSGYCFWLLCCLISWKSKLQPILTKNTHNAELVAADFAADEALWLRRIIMEIGFCFGLPTSSTFCNIHVIGVPKLRPIEEQALFADHYHQPDHLREFAQLFLKADAPLENKLMMLVTPTPDERFAHLDLDTKLNFAISKVKHLLATSETTSVADKVSIERSRADNYDKLHTKDGTLRRFTEDMEPVSNEPYRLGPINLLGDNKAVTFTAKNPLTSSKSRHLDVRWFRLREFVKEGFLRVSHIYTDQNVADFFTKPLAKEPFLKMRRFLMNE